MAYHAHDIEEQVFAHEGVRITISHTPVYGYTRAYTKVWRQPLPDTATLAQLLQRVNTVIGCQTLYGVVNPLGSPTRISPHSSMANVRVYYRRSLARQSRLSRILSWLQRRQPSRHSTL